MTTLHDSGGVLGRPLDTFFKALTVTARGSRVKYPLEYESLSGLQCRVGGKWALKLL